MEEDIRLALADLKADLKSDIKDGFKNVNDRINEMVTRSEFNSEVRRLDERHDVLRKEYDVHVGQTDTIVSSVRAEINEMATDSRRELDTELERFRSSSRWAVGLAVTLSGILFAVIQYLLPG